jgi:hypothetical protein
VTHVTEESECRKTPFRRSGGCITADENQGARMSNIQVAGGPRALPFTGLTTLPILLLGALISVVGFVLTLARPKAK